MLDLRYGIVTHHAGNGTWKCQRSYEQSFARPDPIICIRFVNACINGVRKLVKQDSQRTERYGIVHENAWTTPHPTAPGGQPIAKCEVKPAVETASVFPRRDRVIWYALGSPNDVDFAAEQLVGDGLEINHGS